MNERIHPMSDPAMNGLFTYNELKVVVKNAKRKMLQVFVKSQLMCKKMKLKLHVVFDIKGN